jgi:membrane associated rhomboid family serine protease
MLLERPDPQAETLKEASARFRTALDRVLVFVAVLWAILLVDELTSLDLRGFGVRPGAAEGLVGLLTMPLLHGGFVHLLKNTLPTLTLGVALYYFYPHTSRRVLPWFWLFPGLFVWVVGEAGSTHFGASGLNFALLGFVGLGGLLRRSAPVLALSLAVLFYYGGMLSGVLPIEPGVSWEGHLGGLLIGVVLAVWFRREDIPPRRRYDYEDDDDSEEESEFGNGSWSVTPPDDGDGPRTLH